MQALLAAKKKGNALTSDEIDEFVRLVSTGQAHDSQIGAMLMAIAINGMTHQETADLTTAMTNSGQVMTWDGLVVDKHSTGGVGDKVSIPLGPILAAHGLKVPMISGRGLEITGGTLDKLESIPGFQVELSEEEMAACLGTCGCFIAATTANMCPADRKTYAIRDVTSTVDCIPLITGSILSKKIAEGTKFLVQDIKVGEAAFCKDIKTAEELARSMIPTAKLNGVNMVVTLTKMNQPLGRAVGNSLEIEESIDILRGKHYPHDLMEVILELGSHLLVMTKLCSTNEEAKESMKKSIENGSALKRFKEMLTKQGVTESVANELCYGEISKILPKAKYTTNFEVHQEGYIQSINALKVGTVSFKLGSGRNVPTDSIDPTIGCIIWKKQGDQVQKGMIWATLHHSNPLKSEITEQMNSAVSISSSPCPYESLIIKTEY